MVNGNVKSFVCVKEEKSWNIEPKEINNFYFQVGLIFDAILESISIIF